MSSETEGSSAEPPSDADADAPAERSGEGPRCCFEVFTLFPGAIESFCAAGLVGRAIEQGRVEVHCTDFRRFAHDRYRTVDDAPFGGGAGMVVKPGPVVEALEHVAAARGPLHRILLTPSAPRFCQSVAARLARMPRLGLVCGRYEGIDDRVREHYVDECLSLGDFVLNGGEVAALAIIEAVARLVEGVVGNPESVSEDSFGGAGQRGLLEHPHYTRPADFRGHVVPSVLLSGDHAAVERWRHQQALRRTWALRPDLRPRTALPPDHPVHLAVAPSALPDAAALTDVMRTHDVAGLAVVGADPDVLPSWLKATGGRVPVAIVGEPKALRRRLRRGVASPRFVVLEDAASEPWDPPSNPSPPRCNAPQLLLDVLASEPDPMGPLVLWLGPGWPSGLPIHAIYAPPSSSEAASDGQREDLTSASDLALAPGLAIDGAIAQSPGPRPRTAVLAHAALTQLRDRR